MSNGYNADVMLKALHHALTYSNCTRAQVGAALDTPFSTLYATNTALTVPDTTQCLNHCPRTLPDADLSNYTNCTSIHAEAALLLSTQPNIVKQSAMYITTAPCWDCAKLIGYAKPQRVYFLHDDTSSHRNPQRQVDLLTSLGIVTYEVHGRYLHADTSTEHGL